MFIRFLLTIAFLSQFTISTNANAFTDEAIRLAREWVIQNGEAMAKGAARALVARAVKTNREFNDIEEYNEKIDSLCAPGSEGLKGCKDVLTGGTTFRSCGGTLCGSDPHIAVIIESSCGLLSPRNPLKVAEFETSSCASKAWGKIRSSPEILNDVVGDAQLKNPLNNVNQVAAFKKDVLLGILEVDQPKIVGAASGWDDAHVTKKLQEYLRYDKKGLIKGGVDRMTAIAGDLEASKKARQDPKAFAALVTKNVLYPPVKKSGLTIGTGRSKEKEPAEGSQKKVPSSPWQRKKPNTDSDSKED